MEVNAHLFSYNIQRFKGLGQIFPANLIVLINQQTMLLDGMMVRWGLEDTCPSLALRRNLTEIHSFPASRDSSGLFGNVCVNEQLLCNFSNVCEHLCVMVHANNGNEA